MADGTIEHWLRNHPEGEQLAQTAGLLRAVAGGGEGLTLDPTEVSAYVDRKGSPDERLPRLSTDPVLRRQVASAARLIGDGARRSMARRSGLRWRLVPLAVAAAASLAVIVLPRGETTPPDDASHRAGAITAAEISVLSPGGMVSSAPRVTWSPVLGADLYEMEVTAVDGRVVFRERTMDTALQVPPDVLTRGVRLFFRVRARVTVGRWIASDFYEFVVQP